MKMKLLTLQYQRNGVSGEGFYAATVQNLTDTKGKFLITFTTELDGDKLEYSSSRCVMLEGKENPFYECWRGDNIGGDLQKLLNELKAKHNVESWYDLHLIYENKVTKHKLPVRYNKPEVTT